jgi:ligand-binding sensor domain-containing protein
VADEDNGPLRIGAWRQGLHSFENGLYSTDQSLTMPIVSLSPGKDGSLWAATADAIYYRKADNHDWEQLELEPHLGNRLVQVICYQLASIGGEQIPTLWIGSSMGLLRYPPGRDYPWEYEKNELEQLSIQALALDPLTNYLWIGTSAGLFSEPGWKSHKTGDVRAIAFGPAPGHELLVGFADHFERWPSPENAKIFEAAPVANISSREGGLAADMVTAIAVRAGKNSQEIWIGSPAGISSYRYEALP